MALSRRIARPLLASMFVVGGLDAVRHPGGKVKAAEAVTGPLTERFDFLPSDPETLIRVNGALQVGAGVLLATGRFPRIASLALIGSVIPTTYAGHRFWEETDEATRAQQRVHFLKNLGLVGGLLLAAVDTEGAPSLGWRARRQAHQIEAAVGVGRAAGKARTRSAAHASKESAAHATDVSRRAARKAARQAGAAAVRAGRKANATSRHSAHTLAAAGVGAAQVAQAGGRQGLRQLQDAASDAIRESRGPATHALQQATSVVADTARQLEPLVQNVAHTGIDAVTPYLAPAGERSAELLSQLGSHLGEYLTAARD
jgi:uncharacterized membrane protein YphA (DoxX/SURF4 family)